MQVPRGLAVNGRPDVRATAPVARRAGPAAVVALWCALLAACSAAAQPPPGPAAPAMDHGVGAAGGGAPGSRPGESPADSALRLEALLGQHSLLAADMMRGRIRNDEDFGQAANAAIARNADDLGRVIATLFGEQAASGFRPLWADHATALFTYSRGLATNDPALRDDARMRLVAFENALADFFSGASNGRLPRDAARTAVLTHVDHLLQQADAYAARDYARANALYRQSYAHTFDMGHTLAVTLLPPEEAATLEQPAWRLRSGLDRLLGEHVALAVDALRAAGTNSPDLPAAADALNGNTGDLATAVGTLFGAPAGQEFLSLWADHVDQLVAYTAGVAAGDDGRRRAALDALRGVEGRLAAFLASATGSRIPSTELAGAFLAHDEMLTRQVDAFAAKDHRRAHELAYDTYQDMFGLANRLAGAFGETVAARLPQGGARTGAGGVARAPGPP
jgi:hypothetical protein